MVEPVPSSLPTLLNATAVLIGAENKGSQSPNLAAVLKSRLVDAYRIVGESDDNVRCESDLEKLQYMTAKLSLSLVEQVQDILDPIEESTTPETDLPQLGTRDLSQVRTLLSIVFKWATQPLCSALEVHNPDLTKLPTGHIVDLTDRRLDLEDLPSLIFRIFSLIFTSGHPSKIRQTWITKSILNHAIEILSPSLLLGWSSRTISDSLDRASEGIKALSIRFINLLRPHEAISVLGAILSSSTNSRTSPRYVSKACSHLLSSQLRRPDGVRGLCVAIFGDETENSETVPLEKIEHVARILRTVPSNMRPDAYFQFMIPRVLEFLLPALPSDVTPPSHKRAAAFALSRMVSPGLQHNTVASSILLSLLHEPFLSSDRLGDEVDTPPPSPATRIRRMPPVDILQTLQAILLHMDPSPAEMSTLVTPIVPELFSILALYRSSKIADPTIRESLTSVLNTWGRIVGSSDVIDGLCRIVDGAGGEWELDLSGFRRSTRPTSGPSISLLTAAQLETSSKDDIDIHSNPFNLRPDPSSFVGYLKVLDRKDVSSEIFVRLLNEYRELKENNNNPIRTLLHVQLILQIQSQLSSAILSSPEHVLSFVKHALASESISRTAQAQKQSQKKRGIGLEDLRIVEIQEPEEGDSDDEETEQLENGGGKDEMLVTAITLLLSILEGNPDISPQASPDLNDILSTLGDFSSHTSPDVRQLAREARLVLTARTATTSSNTTSSTTRPKTRESTQETYQKALKLLQDPIIPVRAHGLQLLRDLVSGRPRAGQPGGTTSVPLLDPALVPGILSIFLQSIQDDESYIFLNAVQGLAAMVDGYGKDVLRGVMDVYLSGTGVGGSGGFAGSGAISKEELDARIRVGEALSLVVKRCGSALGLYIEILIYPLLTILRSSQLPITLRTSALAILAQCVETHSPALIKYAPGLMDACVELLKLENVAAKSFPGNRDKRNGSPAGKEKSEEQVDDPNEMSSSARRPESTDIDPLTSDAKVAAFRRSALHFLSHLFRAHIAMIYDARQTSSNLPAVTLTFGSSLQKRTLLNAEIPESLIQRIDIVLKYVAVADEDVRTRVMAKEASEILEQYRQASLGF